MTDPYRRDPKDIALADGREELRTDRFECEIDNMPWEADHADEVTVYYSSERTLPVAPPPSYVCQHCGLAILHSALVVGSMYFCGEFCKERYAAKMGQD